MSGFLPVALLAAACWLVRLAFIVLIPAERLPRRLRAALGHVIPAVLAALVSVQAVGVARGGTATAGWAALACLAAIAAVARRRPNLTVSASLGIAAVLLIDLVPVR